MTEKEAFILLNKVPGLGSIQFRRLLDYFGSARNIFSSSSDKLRKVENVSDKIAANILKVSSEDLKEELALVKKYNVDVLSIHDKDYPENLKTIPDPPPVIYIKGKLLPEDDLAIAIVGSRCASAYGLSTADRFAQELGSLGVSIISGMARGIDSAAHRGALKAKARTITVLGSGLVNIYPPENVNLFEEICKSGAVISEFPMNTKPLAYNFPRRNRIISGLSLGVVIVEASRNSGALITADFALEQGREVFCLPGRINSITSFGSNKLIKQGAKLVQSIDDIIEELEPILKSRMKELKVSPVREFSNGANQPEPAQKKQILMKPQLSKEEALVYDLFSSGPLDLDDIIDKSQLPVNEALSMLTRLELKKLVKQSPGKIFAKVDEN